MNEEERATAIRQAVKELWAKILDMQAGGPELNGTAWKTVLAILIGRVGRIDDEQ